MTYMQRGNYVVVVNPLSYSEVMSTDHSLSWGVYDTVTNAFFSVSQKANPSLLNSMIQDKESVFQKDNRYPFFALIIMVVPTKKWSKT